MSKLEARLEDKWSYTFFSVDVYIYKDNKLCAWVADMVLNRIDLCPRLAKYSWPTEKYKLAEVKPLADAAVSQIVKNLSRYTTTWSK